MKYHVHLIVYSCSLFSALYCQLLLLHLLHLRSAASSYYYLTSLTAYWYLLTPFFLYSLTLLLSNVTLYLLSVLSLVRLFLFRLLYIVICYFSIFFCFFCLPVIHSRRRLFLCLLFLLCYFVLMSNSLITDCCLLLLFIFISSCYLLRLATLYGLLVTAAPFIIVRFYLLVHLFSTSCYSPLPLMPSSVRGKVRQPRVAGRTQLLAKLSQGETIEDAHIPQVSSHTRPQGTGALSLPVCVYLNYCVSCLSVSIVTLLVSVFLYVCLCVCV